MQRGGDAQKGYDTLVNNGIVACGIPWSIYSRVFGAAPDEDRLPGRTGRNATLPFNQTALTTSAGVEVVSANCLTCHAGRINGRLETMGWKHTVVDHGKPGEVDDAAKRALYDTDQLGYSNAGHTFGDVLTDVDRKAVLEYLKTL
jgi:mono/diheme cytochrome c family protein